jgi:hypothetical protein
MNFVRNDWLCYDLSFFVSLQNGIKLSNWFRKKVSDLKKNHFGLSYPKVNVKPSK